MVVRSYPIRHPLDLRLTLAPLGRGPYDPTIRLATGRAWWATRTHDGPATVALVHAGDVLRAEAWGPGADRALATSRPSSGSTWSRPRSRSAIP